MPIAAYRAALAIGYDPIEARDAAWECPHGHLPFDRRRSDECITAMCFEDDPAYRARIDREREERERAREMHERNVRVAPRPVRPRKLAPDPIEHRARQESKRAAKRQRQAEVEAEARRRNEERVEAMLRALVAERKAVREGEVCPRCHGAKSRNAERCWDCYQEIKRDIDERGRFIRTVDPIEYVCSALGPRCQGRKVPTASSCWPCYQDAGGHRGRKHAKHLRGSHVRITQEVLDDCRRLYDGGRSMREVAAMVLHRTAYRNERTAASCLFDLFRARDWPLRPQGSATGASNAARHLVLPQCERVRTQGARAGERCTVRVGIEPYEGQYLCPKHLPKPEQRRRKEARLASRDS